MSENPVTLAPKIGASVRQVRYWIDRGLIGPPRKGRDAGGERIITREEAIRLASIATLVKSLGMSPEKAGAAAKSPTLMASGVYVAELPGDVKVFWRNPTI